MTETQKRIKAYQKALPHMRERVIAVAMLLVVSLSMVTSASFAWITLSINPEVASVTTTIAANGNLEIALSGKDGLQPKDTTTSDGNTDDVSISNLTWGNLVNLAHESYGLDYLTLRPATLNTADLASSPIYSVNYASDGRVLGIVDEFGYSVYDAKLKSFMVPEEAMEYGVRAVSSVIYKDLAGQTFLDGQLSEIAEDFKEAKRIFSGIYGNMSYMSTVSALVAIHVNVTVSDADESCNAHLESLANMMTEFMESVEKIGETAAEIANLYLYLSLEDKTQFEDLKFSAADAQDGTLKNKTFKLTDAAGKVTTYKYSDVITVLKNYKSLYDNTKKANDSIQAKYLNSLTGTTIMWLGNDMDEDVNLLCDMDTATLNGYRVSQIQGDPTGIGLEVIGAPSHTAVINGGALKDVDQYLGTAMYVYNPEYVKIKIDTSYKGIPLKKTVTPTIITGAKSPYELVVDTQKAEKAAAGGTGDKGQPTAADTYAMAIDFWVRTNSVDPILILEGEIQYRYEEVKDAEGNIIYEQDPREPSNPDATIAVTEPIPDSYSGVNRVWSDLEDPNSDYSDWVPDYATSTTQGSGSCYVFYPTDPANQTQSLELLRNMRIAFIGEKSELLGQAFMDVDNAIEDGGRVIVPLRLRAQLEPVKIDEDTEEVYYITQLKTNVAQRITALVYLDGANLTNKEVMEAGSIKGQLNIQFGTSETYMSAAKEHTVMDDFYTVTVVSEKSITYTEADVEPWTTPVKLQIEGIKPSSVKGTFISQINQTQGAREPEFSFTYNDEGEVPYWEANVDFSGPGNYILRSIQIDGVDIELNSTDYVTVTIPGVDVKSITCVGWTSNPGYKSVLVAENTYEQEINLSLSADGRHEVRAEFIGDSGELVPVTFTYKDKNEYIGKASFYSGGVYRLNYLYIDGQVKPLDEKTQHKVLELRLGLRAVIYMDEPVLTQSTGDPVADKQILDKVVHTTEGYSFNYDTNKKDDTDKIIPLEIPVQAVVVDDKGNGINLSETVNLAYSMGNSETNVLEDGALTWDEELGRYTGKLLLKTNGIYEFLKLQMGDNIINQAKQAPKITSMPPDPVKLATDQTKANNPVKVVSMGATRIMKIYLQNAAAATANVVLTDYNGNPYKVNGITVVNDEHGYNVLNVEVPSDGNYTITGLYLSNVFDGNKIYSGTELLDMSAQIRGLDIKTEFITTYTVKVANDIGTTPTTGLQFMQENPLEGMTWTVVDYLGRPITDLPITAELIYQWNRTSNTIFTTTAADNQLPQYQVTPSLTISDGVITVGKENYLLNGQYLVHTASVTVGNKTIGSKTTDLKTEGMLKSVTVNWVKPTVKISSTSQNNGQTITYDSNKTTKTASVSTYSCTLYLDCNAVKPNRFMGLTIFGVTCPSVTLQLTNVENYDTAIVTVPGGSNTTYAPPREFSFAKGQEEIPTAQNSLGGAQNTYVVIGTHGAIHTPYPQGSHEINTINLTYGGITYAVQLSNTLTINNPS